jgi:hypothetical protein
MVEPTMGCKVKSSKNLRMNLPDGLYGQIFVWTGFAQAKIDVSDIELAVDGSIFPAP